MNSLCYKFTDWRGAQKILENRNILFKRADQFIDDEHELKLLNKLLRRHLKIEGTINIRKLLKEAEKMIGLAHEKEYREALSNEINNINNIDDVFKILNNIEKYKGKPEEYFIFSSRDDKNDPRMWVEYAKVGISPFGGVCLAFDKNELLKSISNEVLKKNHYNPVVDAVKYLEDFYKLLAGTLLSNIYRMKAVNEEGGKYGYMIRENPYKYLDAVNHPWLQKDMEYRYEQEHRFVIPRGAISSPLVDHVDDKLFVPYGESLKKVFLPPMSESRFAECKEDIIKLDKLGRHYVNGPDIKIEMHTFKVCSGIEGNKLPDIELEV